MKSLNVYSGFTKIKVEGPVYLYQHYTGKCVVVTKRFDGKLIHQGRVVTLQQLVTRKKLVTRATAEQHFQQAVAGLGALV